MARMLWDEVVEQAERGLADACAAKVRPVMPERPCGPVTIDRIPVDLVVLFDTSDSMRDDMLQSEPKLYEAVNQAIEDARAEAQTADYQPDLRVCWLGIEGVWPQTSVAETAQKHLLAAGVAPQALRGRKRNTVPNQGAQEDGARAIIDLAAHFPWRRDALRLILYVSDEPLEGGFPHNAADVRAVNQAITIARANRVKVYTYTGTGPDKQQPDLRTARQLARLARETGGAAFTAPVHHVQGFRQALLTELQTAAPHGSHVYDPSPIRPYFTLHWGEGCSDAFETDGAKTVWLVAANPYANLTLRDLTVLAIEIVAVGGLSLPPRPPPTQAVIGATPDLIHYGDLPPANHAGATRVSREFVLAAAGAPLGRYRLKIHYQCWASFHPVTSDKFALRLMES